MKTVEERLSKHDKEIAAIRKLVLTGMKMLVKMEKQHFLFKSEMEKQQFILKGEQVALREDMRKLAAAQRVTEEKLQGLIQSLTRGGNGRH
jgi:hypothetical protein